MVDSLQTYKSTLSHQNKGKSIVLKSIKKEHDYSSNDDLNSKDIALIPRKFRKIMFKKNNNGKDKKKGKSFSKINDLRMEVKAKMNLKNVLSVLNVHNMVTYEMNALVLK